MSHFVLYYFTSATSFELGFNWKASMHTLIYWMCFCALHVARSELSECRMCSLHGACGTDSHTRQQQIIKSGISTSVFKIFISAEKSGAEMKRVFCHDQRKWTPIMMVFSAMIQAQNDMTLFQMTFLLNVSRYSNRTQHLWENET